MFKAKITALENFICNNAKFKRLSERSWDDGVGFPAFFIEPVGTAVAFPDKGWTLFKKKYHIFIQFQHENDLPKFVRYLIDYFNNSPDNIFEVTDDSKAAFQMVSETDYNDSGTTFATVTVQLVEKLIGNKCPSEC